MLNVGTIVRVKKNEKDLPYLACIISIFVSKDTTVYGLNDGSIVFDWECEDVSVEPEES